jgi:heptaprenylglyceryl phosphate synthase
MKNIYQEIHHAKSNNQKLLAILLDPDKLDLEKVTNLVSKINQSPATHILVGGSSFEGNHLDELILLLKQKTTLPILLSREIQPKFPLKLMVFCFCNYSQVEIRSI